MMAMILLLVSTAVWHVDDAHATPTRTQQIAVASGKRINFIDGSSGSLIRTVSTKFKVQQLTWSTDRTKISWVTRDFGHLEGGCGWKTSSQAYVSTT